MSNNMTSKCPIMVQILVQADYTKVRFAVVLSTENLFVIFSEIGPKCYVLSVLPLVSAISRKKEQVCFSGNLVKFFFSVLFQVFVVFHSVGNDTKVRFAVVLSTEKLFVIFSEIGPKCYVLAVLPLVCAISRKNEYVCFSGDLVKIFLVTFRLLTLFLICCFLNTICEHL